MEVFTFKYIVAFSASVQGGTSPPPTYTYIMSIHSITEAMMYLGSESIGSLVITVTVDIINLQIEQ